MTFVLICILLTVFIGILHVLDVLAQIDTNLTEIRLLLLPKQETKIELVDGNGNKTEVNL